MGWWRGIRGRERRGLGRKTLRRGWWDLELMRLQGESESGVWGRSRDSRSAIRRGLRLAFAWGLGLQLREMDLRLQYLLLVPKYLHP